MTAPSSMGTYSITRKHPTDTVRTVSTSPTQAPWSLTARLRIVLRQDDVIALQDIFNTADATSLRQLKFRSGVNTLVMAVDAYAVKCVRYMVGLDWIRLDESDFEGETALYHACTIGYLSMVELLVRAGANINAANKESVTPLIISAYRGYTRICQYLLRDVRICVDFQDNTRKTALMLACYQGHRVIAETLIQRGSNINITDQYGWTALMLAAHAGHQPVVELLLSSGASANILTNNGKTAAILALEGGYRPIGELIMRFAMQSRPSLEAFGNEIDRRFYPRMGHELSVVSGSTGTPDVRARKQATPTLHTRSAPGTSPQVAQLGAMGTQPLPYSTFRRHGYFTRSHGRPPSLRSAENPRRKPMIGDPNEIQPDSFQNQWAIMASILTCCVCDPCLSWCCRFKRPAVRQAWREKVALCIIICLLSLFIGLLGFALTSIICEPLVPIYREDVDRMYGPDGPYSPLMIIRGRLYDVGDYFRSDMHGPISSAIDMDILDEHLQSLYGSDVSDLFPYTRTQTNCPFWPRGAKRDGCPESPKDMYNYCHSGRTVQEALFELRTDMYVSYTWKHVQSAEQQQLFAYNGFVYDVGGYLARDTKDQFIGDNSTTEWIQSLVGTDATMEISRSRRYRRLMPCFDTFFLAGRIEGTTIGCFATNLITIISATILIGITTIKFISAILFDWFLSWHLGKIVKAKRTAPRHHRDDDSPPILMLVTCYSENEASIRGTLESLATTTYSDTRKLLVVVADGEVTGSGNVKSTPDMLLNILQPNGASKNTVPIPRYYESIGDGLKRMNMAQVYGGTYVCEHHRVPYILIVKRGTYDERVDAKPGNRGKRDSQLILMQFLARIGLNDHLSPLEFELYTQLKRISPLDPESLEMLLMVDADTVVMPDSVSRMVAAMRRDPKVMGLCGETKIENKTTNWVTMIQVYEYYISHHLGKAFESIFGGVTCLPGCFCMYRIRTPPTKAGHFVPLLIHPEVVEEYSCNTVTTLHQKNLLLLGEDRFLTTLMLRTFPKRKMIYVPRAVCETVVPEEFHVLLSQRRRWINSTVHNLMELLLVPQLCGTFCFSMQFVIFLELIGTVVLPAMMGFLIYLVVQAILGAKNITLPLLMMAVIYVLQALLILATSRHVSYIVWMVVYVLAMPIWNFALPLYAFWNFDDFSWGTTRRTDDASHSALPTTTAAIIAFETQLRARVPRKRLAQWKSEAVSRTLTKSPPAASDEAVALPSPDLRRPSDPHVLASEAATFHSALFRPLVYRSPFSPLFSDASRSPRSPYSSIADLRRRLEQLSSAPLSSPVPALIADPATARTHKRRVRGPRPASTLLGS